MDGGRDKTTDGLRELSSLPDEELAPSGLQAELVRERVKAALFGEPAQPRRLGRFVLLEQIGVGGLGHVYAAYDEKVDRKVALKLVRPRVESDDRARLRLLREARALGRLSHENIVSVYDVGEVEGQIFLVMELVHGRTLSAWLAKQARLPEPERWQTVLRAFTSAGRGLAAAHRAGVIHRDFKPENVIVGHDGRVRVVDFGLARADESVDPRDEVTGGLEAPAQRALPGPIALVTEPGRLAGTPAYMAPEQILGRTCDGRSDQFSFCVALYEALHGEHPFLTGDLDGWRQRVLESAPAEPSGSELPARIARAVRRGLEKRAEDRFPTMEALLEALHWDPHARSRRTRAALGGLGLTALLGLSFVATSPEAHDPCALAARPVTAIWNGERADRLQRAFEGLPGAGTTGQHVRARLDRYAGELADSRTSVCRATYAERRQSEALFHERSVCLERRERDLSALVTRLVQPDAAAVRASLDAVAALPPVATCLSIEAPFAARERDLWAADPALVERARALAQRIADVHARHQTGPRRSILAEAEGLLSQAEALAHAPVLAEALYRVGAMRLRDEEWPRAEDALRRARSTARSHGYDDLLLDIELLLVLLAQRSHDSTVLGHEWAGQALDSSRRLGERGDRHARAQGLHAALYFRDRDYHRAAALEREAVAEARAHGREPLELANRLAGLGNTLAQIPGQEEQAAQAFAEAWSVHQRELGPGHPYSARLRYDMGRFLTSSGEHERALEHVSAAIASWSGVYQCQLASAVPEEDCKRIIASAWYQLALIEQKLGRLVEAAEHARKSRAMLERFPRDRALSLMIANRDEFAAIQSFHARRYQDAADGYLAALETRAPLLGDAHVHTLQARIELGEALVELGRYEQALAHFADAERHIDALADAPLLRGLLYQGRGLALLGRGLPDDAHLPLEQARLALEGLSSEAPDELADVLFGLARASGRAAHEHRRALAERARALYRDHTPHGAAQARAVTEWLESHP